MRHIMFVRAALIGLAGLLCAGCLEAGPRGYFESSVYGSTPVDQSRELQKATRSTHEAL